MKIMETEKKLPELLKDQIKLEKEIANRLTTLEKRVDSIAARLLIREMQLDSKKHAEILQAALEVIGGPKSFWEYTVEINADKGAVKKELEDHIKAEQEMIRQLKEETKRTNDEALKLLLKHFEEDEKKHHENIQTILHKAYKVEL
jgi:ferritin-like metal-binding protein YciE